LRKPLLVGNWKMNKLIADVQTFCTEFGRQEDVTAQVSCMIAPTYLGLQTAAKLAAQSRLGVVSQNVHHEKSGAFTGEISIQMLADIGVRASIVGHSERRQFFGETDQSVALKTRALLNANFLAITCVGETQAERQSGKTFEVVSRQLSAVLNLIEYSDNFSIAYEPVWAIGTGLNATPEQAQEVHAFIRKTLSEKFGKAGADKTRILYGGSVKSSNIQGLYAQPCIDGALVGGASLDPQEFWKIGSTIAGTKK
jgi:triosephosphate isomerase